MRRDKLFGAVAQLLDEHGPAEVFAAMAAAAEFWGDVSLDRQRWDLAARAARGAVEMMRTEEDEG